MRQRGFSLIELMIAVSLMGILLVLGIPTMRELIQNAGLRGTAESVLRGLQLARTEAVRRNALVRFQFVSTMGADCVLASDVPGNWVVGLGDPTGACDSAPSDTVDPWIVQRSPAAEGGGSSQVQASTGGKRTAGGVAATVLVFDGLGRVAPGGIDTVDITNPGGGACMHVPPNTGPMRCLRIEISPGGQVRMCDPHVADNADNRFCTATLNG